MQDIDQLIKQVLTEEEAQDLEQFDEQSILEQVAESFKGRSRTLVFFAIGDMLLLLVLGIVAVVKIFHAEAQREMIFWASFLVFALLGIGLIKIWYWMELNKNAILRKVKRLEYLVAILARRMTAKDSGKKA
ncbi:MAG: hypothetical protein M2R45_00415 [Verrucomicrobia subdivision 3 bacterium]|nr:hypothetical protein [Limisphaerales bacterium]MCS1413706.1 hypothetical protein [Limisphaerales bacterium]